MQRTQFLTTPMHAILQRKFRHHMDVSSNSPPTGQGALQAAHRRARPCQHPLQRRSPAGCPCLPVPRCPNCSPAVPKVYAPLTNNLREHIHGWARSLPSKSSHECKVMKLSFLVFVTRTHQQGICGRASASRGCFRSESLCSYANCIIEKGRSHKRARSC